MSWLKKKKQESRRKQRLTSMPFKKKENDGQLDEGA
jgi:hypothetical protein